MNHDSAIYSILIADDNPHNLKLLSTTLNCFGYDINVAIDGKTAIESAIAQPPDLILLDVYMPEIDGFQACKILKSDIRTKEIPVLLVSAFDDQNIKIKVFEVGATDYITKPIQIEEAKARIDAHLKLKNKKSDISKINKVVVDREMRIIELKKEINKLAYESGIKEPYMDISDN